MNRIECFWAVVITHQIRQLAWSARLMRPPVTKNGNTPHPRPGPNTVVCCQQREDWCLGHQEESFSRWMRTPGVRRGAFRSAERRWLPRFHLRSADDRQLLWQLDGRYSCLGCRPQHSSSFTKERSLVAFA